MCLGTDVSLTLDDGVALITFNRPDQKNTLNSGMIDGLSEAYRSCDRDDAVRAVVVPALVPARGHSRLTRYASR